MGCQCANQKEEMNDELTKNEENIEEQPEPNINNLLQSKICFKPSIIVSKLRIRLNFLKLISAICNLLFSTLVKVKISSINIYCIEYKPLGAIGTSIIKFVILILIACDKSNVISPLFFSIYYIKNSNK